MAREIIQFGTSRFLQAHADLFVHEARLAGQDIGPITVVKTSPGSARAGRVHHIARPDGYPVIIRGLRDGQRVEDERPVTSVTAALTAVDDWPALQDLFATKAEIVFSNVGDSGYEIALSDRALTFPSPGIPTSFPGKLLALLAARYAAGGKPLLILPCELIAHNGQVLRDLLTGLAQDWRAPQGFTGWLATQVTLCDTLVDRIVSAEIAPIGAIAEPYALWAVQCPPGMTLPFTHPNVVVTDDLEPYLRLKLHILNLGHSYLAETWLKTGRPADETVRDILSDPAIRADLLSLYHDEVIPGFAARKMKSAASAYVAQTVERFDNPFLHHRLAEIAQNHPIKIARRFAEFLDWVEGGTPELAVSRLALPRLTAIVAAYP